MEAFIFFTFLIVVCLFVFLQSLARDILQIRSILILAGQEKYSELKELTEKLSKNKIKKEK